MLAGIYGMMVVGLICCCLPDPFAIMICSSLVINSIFFLSCLPGVALQTAMPKAECFLGAAIGTVARS